ncbi:MAG: hypothetical protein ACK5MH_05810 [Bacteroidales bacterium]
MNDLHKTYLKLLLKDASTNILKTVFMNGQIAYSANRAFSNSTDDFQKEEFINEMMRIGYLTEHKTKEGSYYKFTKKAKDYYTELIK